MVKPNTLTEGLAREAVARIEAARDAGQQLTFLPDEPQPGPDGQSGRPPRGKGKATSQLRDFLAARGFRMPEDVLVEMAAMASSEDAFLTAMARTEALLAWAQDGAVGYKGAPVAPSMAQRLAAFQFVYTAQLRAAEALLPYGLAKVTPDQTSSVVNQIVIQQGGAVQGGGQVVPAGQTARDVTPQARRLAPPPLPHEMQRNQGLASGLSDASDAGIRTEGASR